MNGCPKIYNRYKLTTRDMGPIERCLGKATPPAQPWQFPLPSPATSLPDFEAVRTSITKVMTTAKSATLEPDTSSTGAANYGAIFVQLAYQCASTFRRTDYLGGCNGAHIRYDDVFLSSTVSFTSQGVMMCLVDVHRFAPQSNWEVNVAMDKALALLQPVKDQFASSLSWADLIVAAAQVSDFACYSSLSHLFNSQ
jgi:catalase-peroxidase